MGQAAKAGGKDWWTKQRIAKICCIFVPCLSDACIFGVYNAESFAFPGAFIPNIATETSQRARLSPLRRVCAKFVFWRAILVGYNQ